MSKVIPSRYDVFQKLADELIEMDELGAIELDMWPTAQAFIQVQNHYANKRPEPPAAGTAQPHDALIRKSAQAIIDWGGSLAEDYIESILEEIVPQELLPQISADALALVLGVKVVSE